MNALRATDDDPFPALAAACGLAVPFRIPGAAVPSHPAAHAFLAVARTAESEGDVDRALASLDPLYREIADWPSPPAGLVVRPLPFDDTQPDVPLDDRERRWARLLAASWLLTALALGPDSHRARKLALGAPVLESARSYGTFSAVLDTIAGGWPEA